MQIWWFYVIKIQRLMLYFYLSKLNLVYILILCIYCLKILLYMIYTKSYLCILEKYHKFYLEFLTSFIMPSISIFLTFFNSYPKLPNPLYVSHHDYQPFSKYYILYLIFITKIKITHLIIIFIYLLLFHL
jgi:hypothetical protein